MGQVVEFPQVELGADRLSEEQRALITLLAGAPDKYQFVTLRGLDQGTGQPLEMLVPMIVWRGHERVILADGDMINWPPFCRP